MYLMDRDIIISSSELLNKFGIVIESIQGKALGLSDKLLGNFSLRVLERVDS